MAVVCFDKHQGCSLVITILMEALGSIEYDFLLWSLMNIAIWVKIFAASVAALVVKVLCLLLVFGSLRVEVLPTIIITLCDYIFCRMLVQKFYFDQRVRNNLGQQIWVY